MLIFIDYQGRRSFHAEAVLVCSSFSDRQLAEIERAGHPVVFREDVPGGYCVQLGTVSGTTPGALLQRCLMAGAAAGPALAALAAGDLEALGAVRRALEESLGSLAAPQPPVLDLFPEWE